MRPDYKTIFLDLQKQLKFIEKSTTNKVHLAENCINICIVFIEKLKQIIITSNFENQADEIFFFKEIKPAFVAQLIYYTKIYHIELYIPTGSDETKKNYLNTELKRLEHFFCNNLDFIKYLRTNNTHLDDKYFLRGAYDIGITLDCFAYEKDKDFSTSHDYKVSKIKANELIEIYIKQSIADIGRIKNTAVSITSADKSTLKWKATKVDLTELIYALQTTNVFGSDTDIKEIANCLASTFNVEIGDYYHTYLQMRIRKNGKTKFIDTLKENLNDRMNQEELT